MFFRRDAPHSTKGGHRRPSRGSATLAVLARLAGVAMGILAAGFTGCQPSSGPPPSSTEPQFQVDVAPVKPVPRAADSHQAARAETVETPVDSRSATEDTPSALRSATLAAVERLVDDLPGTTEPMALLALARHRFGDHAAAAECWRRCLELDAGFADAWHGLGSIALEQGKDEEAASHLRKAVEVRPEMPEVRIALADALMNMGNMEEVIAVLEEDIPCVGISRITLADMQALDGAGYAVKLLGSAGRAGDRVAASVFPWALPKADALAGVGGAGNYVEVDAQYLGRVGFMGPGAGRLPTAHAMVNDLMDAVLNRQPRTSPLGGAALQSLGGRQIGRFYLRGQGADKAPHAQPLGPGWLVGPMPLADVLALLAADAGACAIMLESLSE